MQTVVEWIKKIVAGAFVVLTAAYILIAIFGCLIFDLDGAYLMSVFVGVTALILLLGIAIALIVFISWLLFASIKGGFCRIIQNPPILFVWLLAVIVSLGFVALFTCVIRGTPILDFLGQILQNIFAFLK